MTLPISCELEKTFSYNEVRYRCIQNLNTRTVYLASVARKTCHVLNLCTDFSGVVISEGIIKSSGLQRMVLYRLHWSWDLKMCCVRGCFECETQGHGGPRGWYGHVWTMLFSAASGIALTNCAYVVVNQTCVITQICILPHLWNTCAVGLATFQFLPMALK